MKGESCKNRYPLSGVRIARGAAMPTHDLTDGLRRGC
jgi:hypothetical protein